LQKLLLAVELTETYRTEVERVKKKNKMLKENLAVQKAEVAKYKSMAKQKHVVVEGQSLEAPTEAELVQPTVIPSELFAELWNCKSRDPKPRGLFQVYKRQC
jgi:hypothetical protein